MDKILIVLNGESFRDGGTGVRSSGNNQKSIIQQRCAINSHIRFFKYIENKFGFTCEVFINSYKSNGYENEMIKSYNDYLIGYNFHTERLNSEFSMIEDTITRLNNINMCEYKFILFIRNDIFLKEYFLDVFKIDNEKIIYAFVDSNPSFNKICEDMNMEQCNFYVPVNHMITLIPEKYYYLLLEKKAWYWHYSASRFLSEIKNNLFIDFFVQSVHWCNSSHEWNPLFVQVGRVNSFNYEECKSIQIDVPSSEFIIASKGIKFDNKKLSKILINDSIYDNLRNEELFNEELKNFYL